MKRTRHVRNYFLTIPRVVIRDPGVYVIKVKLSQVIIEKIKDAPGRGKERGRVDSEEEVKQVKPDYQPSAPPHK